MQILVTGGTGFTGSALAQRLAQDGHRVRVLDQARGIADDHLRQLGVQITYGSVADRDLVHRLTAGCERVYHLAAAFRRVNLGRHAYYDANVNGTRWVMSAALAHDVARVVYCSTCGVHGNVAHPPAAEDAPIAPSDYYQRTKWEGELVAHDFMERGLPVTVVRPTAIYGPGDPERFLHIFRRVARGRFVFLGDGEPHYHPVYIDNLIDGFLLAAERDEAVGQTYLLGDARSLPIRDLVVEVSNALDASVTMVFLPFAPAYAVATLVELAYRPLPAEPPIFRRRLDWFRQHRAFDIGKACRELGYEPRVDLADGLRRTAAWYRERGFLAAPASHAGVRGDRPALEES